MHFADPVKKIFGKSSLVSLSFSRYQRKRCAGANHLLREDEYTIHVVARQPPSRAHASCTLKNLTSCSYRVLKFIMKSLIKLTTVLAAVALSSSSIVKSPSSNEGNFELLILHNNDMHARFEQTSQVSNVCTTADREAGKCYGGFPRVAYVVKKAREAAASGQGPPVLYLNAGDTYTGTAWFTIYKWQIAAEFINALQPDAVSLGNHELDENVEGLIPFLKNLLVPVLAANLILDKEPEWQKETNIQQSIILSKNGTNIGIIGYLTPDTKFLSPRNNIEYEEEVFAITREVKKLKQQGVNILIALGHSGYSKDLQIARDVPDLDIVVGGHSHTLLWNHNNTEEKPEIPQGPYPSIVKQSSGREVLVVQAYAFTKYMGKLHLIFDPHGEIIQYVGEPLLLDHKAPRDPELLELINKYRKDVDNVNNEVVGNSLVFLDGNKCRLWECNMGDFIADTILNYSIEKLGRSDLTISVIQGGRIRTSIDSPNKPFQLTRGDWITVLPFEDGLVAVTANGSVLLQSLEHSVAAWRTIDSSGQFLQFSGIEVTYDLAKPPGSRVVKARAVCSTCGNNLSVIDENYEYKIIMSDYLANNGDGFTMFEPLYRENLFYTEIDSVLEYLRKNGPVNYSESGRITILNEDNVMGNIPEVGSNTIKNLKYLPSNGANFGQSYFVLFGMFTYYVYLL